jgi:hypothetical protein
MLTVEGTHARGGSGAPVRYHAEYEVAGGAIHFRATFDNGAAHQGEFDFDPAKLDAAAAVDAFLQNHIRKADWAAAP